MKVPESRYWGLPAVNGVRVSGPAPEAEPPPPASGFAPETGYSVSGDLVDGGEIIITKTGGGFGIKPGGGPCALWDFGDDCYEHGVLNGWNALRPHGYAIGDEIPQYTAQGFNEPLVDRVNPRSAAVSMVYRAPPAEPGYSRNGGFFFGITALGGKTSTPPPFRDNRYYYSMRNRYDTRSRDGTISLKVVRGSQRDSTSIGYGGYMAGRINKHQWQQRGDAARGIAQDPANYVSSIFSTEPQGAYEEWHLTEMFIDPSGTYSDAGAATVPGTIPHFAKFTFSDIGQRYYLPAIHPDTGRRYTLTDRWDSAYGFYHQVGPESSAGSPPCGWWFGEVYADDSWRRILISDSLDPFAQSAKFELQRITEWTDTTLRCVGFRGAFTSFAGKHFFWIDNNNAPHFIGTFTG